jgi:hypothetical protein
VDCRIGWIVGPGGWSILVGVGRLVVVGVGEMVGQEWKRFVREGVCAEGVVEL